MRIATITIAAHEEEGRIVALHGRDGQRRHYLFVIVLFVLVFCLLLFVRCPPADLALNYWALSLSRPRARSECNSDFDRLRLVGCTGALATSSLQ
mmetsp:Transcript_14707/g.31923  ORF Transcript_14707/g.31923 Transcript_14707/m.31923 type:complete len:95 (-) Transcript_14707:74-358(-)